MRRLVWLAGLLLSTASWADSATVLRRGLLSPASTASPLEIAQSYLRSDGIAHRVLGARRAGAGTMVRLQRTHAGLDIVGGEIALRLDALGRVRWVSLPHRRGDQGLRELDTRPRLSAKQALALAAGGVAAGLDPARHARLLVYSDPALVRARLAWHVVTSDELRGHTFRAYLDAHSGELLAREQRSRRAAEHRAWVHPQGAASSQQTVEVVLGDLPSGATHLTDAEVEVLSCEDRRSCHPVLTTTGTRRVHTCDFVPKATTNQAGSFLEILPPADPAVDSAFAEVQLYHQIRTGFAAFRSWADDPGFKLKNKFTAIVNMRFPDLSSPLSTCSGPQAQAGSQLQRKPGASFWPAGDLGPTEVGDRMLLNAGWSYDSSVVFHELTHGVMYSYTPLAWKLRDSLGLNCYGGGIHEGFSDYFADAISGSGEGAGHGYLRSRSSVKCTDVLTGEEHQESEAWSGALWAIRESLADAAERHMMDAAMLRVILALGHFDTFPEAQALVEAELQLAAEEQIERRGLDEHAASALRAAIAKVRDRFTDRGLPGCGDRVLGIAPGESKSSLYAYGPTGYGLAPGPARVPAPIQLRLTLPVATRAIALSVSGYATEDDSGKGESPPPALRLLLKQGSEPIRWTWSSQAGSHDAEAEAEVLPRPEGGSRSLRGVIKGSFPAGVYHLQLTNSGQDQTLHGLSFLYADESGRFVDGKGDHLGSAPAEGEGCSCALRGPPRAAGRGGWVLLGVALLAATVAARRRRRSAGRSWR